MSHAAPCLCSELQSQYTGVQPHPLGHFPLGGGGKGEAQLSTYYRPSPFPLCRGLVHHTGVVSSLQKAQGQPPLTPVSDRGTRKHSADGAVVLTAPVLKDLWAKMSSARVWLQSVLLFTSRSHSFTSSQLSSRPGTGHLSYTAPQRLPGIWEAQPSVPSLLWVLRYCPGLIWGPLDRQDA
ncbi:hypothetical protein NDU88_003812 [Pleurodeles waltl]|uniref:Uncharacterized protein n=1 Tax=Pleurodeles waltl TaxID=8319 RepID=A0AAV7NHQ2_PLEWA|nr:hypothetical protein NDU88_003812 [Pleurodeles waltl]